jgi:hypothetical protein
MPPVLQRQVPAEPVHHEHPQHQQRVADHIGTFIHAGSVPAMKKSL